MRKTQTKGLFIGILFFLFVGGLSLEPRASENLPTATVVNTVSIAAPPEVAFDLITTARFWPQWHPASLAVSGVTERPYQLGDRIQEWVRVGEHAFQILWTVVEYQRPSRVKLQSEEETAQISYVFKPQNGKTVFTRKLQYQVENQAEVELTPEEIHSLMEAQSEQGVEQLKALVEKIRYRETQGLP